MKLNHEAADDFLNSGSGVIHPAAASGSVSWPPSSQKQKETPPLPSINDKVPSNRVVDKWQAGNNPMPSGSGRNGRPPSDRSNRSGGKRPSR